MRVTCSTSPRFALTRDTALLEHRTLGRWMQQSKRTRSFRRHHVLKRSTAARCDLGPLVAIQSGEVIRNQRIVRRNILNLMAISANKPADTQTPCKACNAEKMPSRSISSAWLALCPVAPPCPLLTWSRHFPWPEESKLDAP